MHFRGLTLFAGIVLFAASCNDDKQLGGNCGTEEPPLAGELVEGETAVDEIVRIQRDGVCESFQCLTEGGLAPYCTETCSYESSSNLPCNSDIDCRVSTEHCIDRVCKADNCPDGFLCDNVQENGPLANTRYCVRERGCLTNFDCGDVGNVRCEIVACLDACLLSANSAECDTHYLHCQPRTEIPYCLCPGETEPTATTCESARITCVPPEGRPAFPSGAVSLRGICVGNNQTLGNELVAQ